MSLQFIPHNYQKPIQEKLKTHDAYGVFAFPGAGKTVMALDAIYNYKEPTLVITPLSILYTVWTTENSKWDFSQNLSLAILHGPFKRKAFFSSKGVYLINPEGVPWLLEQVKASKRFPWKNLIVDESVRFKNPKAKRFKALKAMLKTFKRRYILCANPMPNNYMDIWAQIFLLDLGERLGSSFYQFRNRYFYPTDYRQFNWELREGAFEQIVNKVKDIVSFVDLSDEIDLPERVVIDYDIELPSEIQKMYKSMEKELFIQISKGENVLAANRTSALMKCWQIANGFMYVMDEEGERQTLYMHDELSKITKEIVEELNGNPIIIAYWFNEDYNRLRALFGEAPHLGSDTTIEELKRVEDRWNKGNIPILLAHISKISHGMNMQFSGCNILFYTLIYNYDTYDQLIRRLERQGSKNFHIFVRRLIMKGTIHEAICKSLEVKCDNSNGFLQCLIDYKGDQK